MARYFEKISFEQFKKDVCDDKELYGSYNIPKRSTKESAGYDFESIIDFTLAPGETKKIPLGVKVHMNTGDVMFLLVRSSQGFKYNHAQIWDMKINAFLDSVKRISKIKNADLLLQSGYSSFGVNLKEISNDQINWLGELD